MIKIEYFNISLKLKQKYLFENLYFLKKSIIFFFGYYGFLNWFFQTVTLSSSKNNSEGFPSEGGLISHYVMWVTT